MEGVHTALVTPFSGGGVDLDAYRHLAIRQLDNGVDGLVPCGTTGEMPTLTRAEWAACIRAAVEVADGAHVTAGIGTNCTATSVDNAHRALDLGASKGLLVLPYYNKPSPRGHKAHVAAVAAVGLPLVLYHVPGRTGQRLPVSLLAELCELDGVVAAKEATGDLRYGSELTATTSVSVLSGDDFTFFPLIAVGALGVISVVSNVAPRITTQLCAAARAGELDEARELHNRLMPLVEWLFSDTNPAPCKAAMAAMGLCEDEVRLPLAPVSSPPPELLEGLS
ncbi:MAG TPA: 4-hydroxy-tetrahydrodipicolinate synthase [Myxococcota bacterium]|nr:4-hydroxy-tetrahydrodipicolinate synthase [Myxococcota bacterium]